MSGRDIAIGTRGSQLALIQARLVLAALEAAGQPARIVVVETEGDRREPDTPWGEGVFVSAIEQALLDGRVDLAVHSAKDLPTDLNPGLEIGAYLARADPRDALVVRPGDAARRLADLPAGARVGTDSPRRQGFLLARRPDLAIHPLHGNVDTRLRQLDEGRTDALVLACAGLDRLGRGDRISERLAPDIVPPAPGQGAVAVQVRRDDLDLAGLVAAIDDRPTRLAVELERDFLRTSGGGCRAPIGGLATIEGDRIELLGGYARIDGSGTALIRRSGPLAAAGLAAEVAALLAAEFEREPRQTRGRVIVTRAASQSGELLAELEGLGLEAIPVPAILIEPEPAGGELDRVAAGLGSYAWVVITSANGAQAIVAAAGRQAARLDGPRWAAIGSGTAASIEAAGARVSFQPGRADARALVAELPVEWGERVLVVRGDLAGPDLASALERRGARVDDVVGYRTVESPSESVGLLGAALEAGPVDAVLFTSGSTVRGLAGLAAAAGRDLGSIPAICSGPRTAEAAAAAGFTVLAQSARPEASAFARITAQALAGLRPAQLEEFR